MTSALSIVIDEGPSLRRDLELIGFPLLAPAEGCRCPLCRVLDLRHDVDALASTSDGRALFVAYRAQPDWDFQTITIRWANDKGNENVQLAKLLDGRSRADIYVQGYPSGVAWVFVPALLSALRDQRTKNCPGHKAADRGQDGQWFVMACARCAGVNYVPRDAPVDPYADLPF